MKSKRAEEYVDSHAKDAEEHLRSVTTDIGRIVLRVTQVIWAVEIAEQDAEQRVRQQAVEAFKSSCRYKDGCAAAGRKCDPALCEDLRSFIEKLRKDETNES